MGNHWLVGTKFQLCKMTKFQRSAVQRCAYSNNTVTILKRLSSRYVCFLNHNSINN